MPSILGIDPGLSGALAFLDLERWTLSVYDMPVSTETKSKTRNEVNGPAVAAIVKQHHDSAPSIGFENFEAIAGAGPLVHAYLENVHSSPQMGVASSFNFGDGYGTIKGVLAALGIPLTKVSPQLWKRTMRAPKDKTEARGRASQLMPDCAGLFARAMDDGRAEASLIALYAALDTNHQPSRPITLE